MEDEYKKVWLLKDLLVKDAQQFAEIADAPGGRWCWAMVVELDGPDHLLACGSPTGATLLQPSITTCSRWVVRWPWCPTGSENRSAETRRRRLSIFEAKLG